MEVSARGIMRASTVEAARDVEGRKLNVPLGPLGFERAQHRRTPRPSVDGTRSEALRPFGSQ